MYNQFMGYQQPQNFQVVSPYQSRLSAMESAQMPRYEVIHVNGENGAKALQMAPNSNVILMDDTAPLVWLAQTDGAGYKTVTPYTISPYHQEPAVDVRTFETRIKRLEEMLNESYAVNAGQRDAVKPTDAGE